MPIYEYLCESCETLTERMQKIGDPAPSKCPECGSRKIAKLVSRTSFQLKGGGWYSDLYATPRKDAERKGTHTPRDAEASGATAPPAGEGKPASEGKPAGEGKSAGEDKSAGESKPAAKPEGPTSKPAASPKKGKRA